jgi:hypothetical protein
MEFDEEVLYWWISLIFVSQIVCYQFVYVPACVVKC